MAYFGDTVAHGALPGVALGIAFGIDPLIGVLAMASAVAMLVLLFGRRGQLPQDAILGMLSHSALAIGIIALSFMRGVRIDLTAFLFGDLLAVSRSDVWITFGGGLAVLAVLGFLWRGLVAATVNADLARAEGVAVDRLTIAFMLLVAAVVALAMKVVGVLLVTSLIVIPAVTARRFARSPEAMALLAPAFGVFAVAAGLTLSVLFDTPSGPSIVVAAFAAFMLVAAIGTFRGER